MESDTFSNICLRSHRDGKTVEDPTELRNPAKGPDKRGTRDSGAPVAAALASRTGRARDTRLVAKAKGALAAELLEIARAYGIAIHRDADLAEILAALEEDAEIPLEALAAVAEILNYIYQSQRIERDESPESHR